jgi:DegV family protein with EDD domain
MGIVKKLKDGDVEIPASLDWDLYTNKELNDWLRGGMQIKTTQVSNLEYQSKFTEILESGKDVLYIACSSALSGSYNLSLMVKDEIKEAHPEANIICVDSLCSCMGQGLMALDCAEMKKQGKTLEECAAYLEENKLCYHQFATVETLDYLKKGGRIGGAAALLGNILQIRPILTVVDGETSVFKKVRTRKKTIEEIVYAVLEDIKANGLGKIIVHHINCEEDGMKLANILEERLGIKIEIQSIGPVIGLHVGPGSIGIAYHTKK